MCKFSGAATIASLDAQSGRTPKARMGQPDRLPCNPPPRGSREEERRRGPRDSTREERGATGRGAGPPNVSKGKDRTGRSLCARIRTAGASLGRFPSGRQTRQDRKIRTQLCPRARPDHVRCHLTLTCPWRTSTRGRLLGSHAMPAVVSLGALHGKFPESTHRTALERFRFRCSPGQVRPSFVGGRGRDRTVWASGSQVL